YSTQQSFIMTCASSKNDAKAHRGKPPQVYLTPRGSASTHSFVPRPLLLATRSCKSPSYFSCPSSLLSIKRTSSSSSSRLVGLSFYCGALSQHSRVNEKRLFKKQLKSWRVNRNKATSRAMRLDYFGQNGKVS